MYKLGTYIRVYFLHFLYLFTDMCMTRSCINVSVQINCFCDVYRKKEWQISLSYLFKSIQVLLSLTITRW